MNNTWINSLDQGSVSITEIRDHIEALREEDKTLLHALMNRMVEDCPSLRRMAAKGLKPFSFHIKLPEDVRPYVIAAIHPQETKGIWAHTRNSLRGSTPTADKQLKWKFHVVGKKEIDAVLSYLKKSR